MIHKMNMQKKLNVLGVVAIVIGCVAGLLCIVPHGFFIAIPVGFIGMICSGIYVFVDTRHEINTKKITPGIIGMGLSSLPVLFMLIFMILKFFNTTH